MSQQRRTIFERQSNIRLNMTSAVDWLHCIVKLLRCLSCQVYSTAIIVMNSAYLIVPLRLHFKSRYLNIRLWSDNNGMSLGKLPTLWGTKTQQVGKHWVNYGKYFSRLLTLDNLVLSNHEFFSLTLTRIVQIFHEVDRPRVSITARFFHWYWNSCVYLINLQFTAWKHLSIFHHPCDIPCTAILLIYMKQNHCNHKPVLTRHQLRKERH